MFRILQWTIASSLAIVLLGCPALRKQDDAGSDGAPAASASAAEAGPAVAVASNDSDVTHYPDQTPANNETLTTRLMAAARTEASATGGKLVTELRPGIQTQKLADHEGFDLVVFPDPKDATQKLEGWVHSIAFTAATPVHVDSGTSPTPSGGGGAPTCNKPPLNIHQSNGTCPAGYAKCGAACRLTCKADSDCCSTPGVTCQAGLCGGACK